MGSSDLRAIRDEMGVSQDELARLLDVSRRTVIRWEQGDTVIPRMVFLALETLRSRKP